MRDNFSFLQAMEAGLKLDLYDLIEELHVTSGRAPTVQEIVTRDDLDVKATARLLNALVAFGILMKQGTCTLHQ